MDFFHELVKASLVRWLQFPSWSTSHKNTITPKHSVSVDITKLWFHVTKENGHFLFTSNHNKERIYSKKELYGSKSGRWYDASEYMQWYTFPSRQKSTLLSFIYYIYFTDNGRRIFRPIEISPKQQKGTNHEKLLVVVFNYQLLYSMVFFLIKFATTLTLRSQIQLIYSLICKFIYL